MDSSEKKCPACAEIIKAEAIKCRFCGEMLNIPAEPPCRNCHGRVERRPAKVASPSAQAVGALVVVIGLVVAFFIHLWIGIVIVLSALIIGATAKVDGHELRCVGCGGVRGKSLAG